MKTSIPDTLAGAGMWGVTMLLPLLIWTINNPEVRMGMLTLVYPILLSIFSRLGRFWVSRSIVAYSALFAFLVSTLLRLSSKMRDALDNPEQDRLMSILGFVTISLSFVICMVLISMFVEPMYTPSNFY